LKFLRVACVLFATLSAKVVADVELSDSDAESAAVSTAATSAAITALAPEGFEDLMDQASEPQYFDIWYARSRIGSSFVSFEQGGQLLLDQPEVIVEWLLQQDLNEQYRTQVQEFLFAPITYIAGCSSSFLSTPRCKRDFSSLSQPIYVTIDEASLRLDIHIGGEWRNQSFAGIQKYIGDSSAGLSSLNQFNGIISGSSSTTTDDNYQLLWNTFISKGNARFAAQLATGSDGGSSVGNAYWQRDKNGRALRAGYVHSGLRSNFFSDMPMILVDYSTEFQTRSGYSDSRSNPIFVFLSERATVEVYREGKLIDVANYEAGNQQLNTERLPHGTYDIELAINEGGVIRTETHRLVKDSRLPDSDETFVQYTVGEIVDNRVGEFEATGQVVARAMVRKRLASSFAGGVGALYDGENAYLESTSNWIGRHHQLGVGGFAGEHRAGAYINGELRFGDFALVGDYRELSGIEDPSLYLSLLGPSRITQNLSARMRLLGGSLIYRDIKNSIDGQQTERSKGLSYRRSLYSNKGHHLFFNGEYTQRESGDHTLVGLSYQWRPNSSSYYSARSEYDRRDTTSRYRNNIQASWYSRNNVVGDIRNSFRATEVDGDGSYGFAGDVKSHWGNAYYNIDQSFGLNEDTSYSARLNWSTVITPDGIEVGGKDVQRSSIVIQIEGGQEDLFDLRVNGRVIDKVKGSSARILNLIPYRDYQVTVTPVDSVYTLSRRSQYVTLYPGNVQVLKWQATKIVSLIGQLYFNDTPLVNARIVSKGVYGQTDAEGWFQFDLSDQISELEFNANGIVCRSEIPHLEYQEGAAFIERLECSPYTQ